MLFPLRVTFVRAGAMQVTRKKRPPTGILDEVRDWVLYYDLGGVNPTVPSPIVKPNPGPTSLFILPLLNTLFL